MGPISEAERRLGLEYINIAERGVKSHPGRRLSESAALVLFDKPSKRETIVSYWSLSSNRAMASETLPFPLGMLWDWDWRAELVEQAFERMTPSTQVPEHDEPVCGVGF